MDVAGQIQVRLGHLLDVDDEIVEGVLVLGAVVGAVVELPVEFPVAPQEEETYYLFDFRSLV